MGQVTKDKIKREIDDLPDSLITRLYEFIATLKKNDVKMQPLPSFDLKGKFDEVNIRSKAYE